MEGKDTFEEAWRRLLQRWETAKAAWNDPVGQAFEQDYWTPLDVQVQQTHRALLQLEQTLAKVKHSIK